MSDSLQIKIEFSTEATRDLDDIRRSFLRLEHFPQAVRDELFGLLGSGLASIADGSLFATAVAGDDVVRLELTAWVSELAAAARRADQIYSGSSHG